MVLHDHTTNQWTYRQFRMKWKVCWWINRIFKNESFKRNEPDSTSMASTDSNPDRKLVEIHTFYWLRLYLFLCVSFQLFLFVSYFKFGFDEYQLTHGPQQRRKTSKSLLSHRFFFILSWKFGAVAGLNCIHVTRINILHCRIFSQLDMYLSIVDHSEH